jgi:hypothetical protein
LKTAHIVNCSWKSANKVNLVCQHAAQCQTGESETLVNKKQMQCKVVNCDPECKHDRQMYAACCAACLQNSCAPGNYGPGPVNQICRGCVPPSPISTTPGPTTCSPAGVCTCPTCPAPVTCPTVQPRKAMQVEGKSNTSFKLVVGLASIGACMLGACVTALAFTLTRKKRQTRQTNFRSPSYDDGDESTSVE